MTTSPKDQPGQPGPSLPTDESAVDEAELPRWIIEVGERLAAHQTEGAWPEDVTAVDGIGPKAC